MRKQVYEQIEKEDRRHYVSNSRFVWMPLFFLAFELHINFFPKFFVDKTKISELPGPLRFSIILNFMINKYSLHFKDQRDEETYVKNSKEKILRDFSTFALLTIVNISSQS